MQSLSSWRTAAQQAFELRESRLTLWHSVAFATNIGAPLLLGWLHYDARLGPLGGILGMLLSLADTEGALRGRLLLLLRSVIAILTCGFIGSNFSGHPAIFWSLLLALTFCAGWFRLSGSGAAATLRYGALALVAGSATANLGTSALAILAFAAAVSATTRTIGHLFFNDETPVLPVPKKTPRPEWWISLRFCAIYAGAVAVGLALGEWQGAERPFWVATTVLLVMQPDPRLSYQRIGQGLLGTCLGVAMAALIIRALHSQVLLALAAGVIAFILPHGTTRNYWLHSAFAAGLILVLMDFAFSGHNFDTGLFAERLRDVTLGCAIVLAATIFAFPPSFKKAHAEAGPT
jgi:hypothetical protein